MTEASGTATLGEEAADDLLSRGYSRRALGRIGAVFGAGALASATLGRPAWAATPAPAAVPDPKTRIGANECWTGPLAPGAAAAAAMIAHGNRYEPHTVRPDFIQTIGTVENVPVDHITPWPGSSDPLARAVVTFCSPTRALVTADPTFELAGRTAEWLGARTHAVPLKPDLTHDVKAMLAADPAPGLIYICSPNNPTGTVTPIADIEWLIQNKPAGTVVLIDEAYTHFAGVPVCSYMAIKYPDVIVQRTFSKLFGMAGLRLGYTMANPEITKKMMRYDGGMQSYALPVTTVACGTASLTAAGLIAARRAEMQEARAFALDHLRKRGVTAMRTDANMFMIDWKTKPAKDMAAAFLAQGVEIGRSWPIWPTANRVTVGSMEDMRNFCAALDKVWVA